MIGPLTKLPDSYILLRQGVTLLVYRPRRRLRRRANRKELRRQLRTERERRKNDGSFLNDGKSRENFKEPSTHSQHFKPTKLQPRDITVVEGHI